MQSENCNGNNAGDAESPLSSYENSPRKVIDFVVETGPFGDNSMLRKISSTKMIFRGETNNSSTDSEDLDGNDLKVKYLRRLELIREKMASIDIANSDYYSNSFECPPYFPNECTITEINDEDASTYETRPSTKKITRIEDNDKIKDHNQDVKENNKDSFLEEKFSKSLHNVTEQTNSNYLSRNELTTNADIKNIRNSRKVFNTESPIELIDLNYNPPKKKPCIRETTPRIVLFDKASELSEQEIFKFKAELKDTQEGRFEHMFPKVKVECTCGTKHIETKDVSCGQSENDDLENPSPNSGDGKDYLSIEFLEAAMEKSLSPRSNQTIITETTVTVESPQGKSNKRRLFLRSARNKIRPINKISLWEEIRTLEAIKKKNRPQTSSSKESYFRKIIIEKPEPEQVIDVKAIGSLDVPRKTRLSARFPSITKISKFCTSVFSKKSATIVEKIKNDEKETNAVPSQKTLELMPYDKELLQNVANTILDRRCDQDINLDSQTPSYEEHSEYSYPEEDIDSYYKPFCIFCFCF